MIEQIEKHLAAVEDATAKAISAALGLPQVEVSKTLHKMVGAGTIEREKRAGGGNEYIYWLVRGDQARAPAVAARETELTYSAEQVPIKIASVGIFDAATAAVSTDEVVDAEVRVADLLATIENLTAERDAARQTADTWRANAATLEARIDELTLGPVGTGAPLFVTVGRTCKPQHHDSLEKAQKRGRTLVRRGKESEVLVLEPVGRIVRGTEWRPR
ncbi:1-pyrroline-5-carboxylate dehydrogenase [Burkholderia ubonensis]|uniref:MarR family transcriptional regulator n=1 Tax=Burkholderia ubonensis TaxID=101571 RepID=UPI00075369BF|nr:MarR family transcriptional regulator [Burkholderia ubonensis]KVO10393.1 1-pyrroline-5-carboxylate dehydrogenase [Burkholderia ubonensis]KVQ71512.1 1-pyrroline-5-carboxylate dehydrogenase [Burkholderia ubonensis]